MSPLAALRAALVVFVLAWLLGPAVLRAAVPYWVAFAVALGLELQFFAAGLRSDGARAAPSRLPQAADRRRFGWEDEAQELVLVRRGGEDVWVPYAGESPEELEALAAEPPAEDAEAVFQPRTRRRAPVRRLLAGLALIAALAALVWWAEGRGWDGLDADTRAEAARLFSAEAGRIVGRPVTIRCDEGGDFVGAVQHADGVAEVGGSLAYLTPQICRDLYRLAFRDEVTTSQTARAIAVLAHEAWHLRGIRDEGTTECYALQSGVELGRRLGLDEATARRLMRQQLAENALRRGRSAEYLLPPGCRDGGPLDLDPARAGFP